MIHIQLVDVSVEQGDSHQLEMTNTVKPVCNDHLWNKSYYLWFIQ